MIYSFSKRRLSSELEWWMCNRPLCPRITITKGKGIELVTNIVLKKSMLFFSIFFLDMSNAPATFSPWKKEEKHCHVKKGFWEKRFQNSFLSICGVWKLGMRRKIWCTGQGQVETFRSAFGISKNGCRISNF